MLVGHVGRGDLAELRTGGAAFGSPGHPSGWAVGWVQLGGDGGRTRGRNRLF